MITETRLEHTSLKWSVVFHGLDHLIDPHGFEGGGGCTRGVFLGPQWEMTVSAM